MADRAAVAASYDAVTRGQQRPEREDDDSHLSERCRKFNNLVKKILINFSLNVWAIQDYTRSVRNAIAKRDQAKAAGQSGSPTSFRDDIVVVDLASGRGGDLRKWIAWASPPIAPEDATVAQEAGLVISSTCRIARVAGVDISPVSVQEAQSRFETVRAETTAKQAAAAAETSGRKRPAATLRMPEVTYEVGDCFSATTWDSPTLSQLIGRVSLVSMQFALHYGCDSLETLRQFLGGVSRLLKPGGFFAATIVDADELAKRLNRDASALPFTPLFSVMRAATEPAASADVVHLGLHYRFALKDLVDCDEFAIPLPVLLREAESFGLTPFSTTMKFVSKGGASPSFGLFDAPANANFAAYQQHWVEENEAIRQRAVQFQKRMEQQQHGAADHNTTGCVRAPESDADQLTAAEWDLVTLYRSVLLQKAV